MGAGFLAWETHFFLKNVARLCNNPIFVLFKINL
jgi:hypothetical protein